MDKILTIRILHALVKRDHPALFDHCYALPEEDYAAILHVLCLDGQLEEAALLADTMEWVRAAV